MPTRSHASTLDSKDETTNDAVGDACKSTEMNSDDETPASNEQAVSAATPAAAVLKEQDKDTEAPAPSLEGAMGTTEDSKTDFPEISDVKEANTVVESTHFGVISQANNTDNPAATSEVSGIDAESEQAGGALDSVALTAMQEAAAMVMEAAKHQKKRKAPETSHVDTRALAPKRTTPSRTSWQERLEQLKEYKEEHGNLLIPIRYKLNPSLGKFVHNTREQYKLYHKKTPPGYKKKCSLTAGRIEQLEALGFAWTTERTKKQDESWSKRLEQLKAFKAKHGHTMVPHGYFDDVPFAEWVHRQRTTYASMLKDEKPSEAVQKRMQQLKDIGFNFTVHADKWLYHLEELKFYKAQHGDCQVPTHYHANGKLGRWVHTQRHQRRLLTKGKKSCMTQERINMLDQLGFSWEVRPSVENPKEIWKQRLNELIEYKSQNGNFKVDPIILPELFAWCQEQRETLRQDNTLFYRKVSKEQFDDLAAIGFDKDVELLEPLPGKSNDPSTKEPSMTEASDGKVASSEKEAVGTEKKPVRSVAPDNDGHTEAPAAQRTLKANGDDAIANLVQDDGASKDEMEQEGRAVSV